MKMIAVTILILTSLAAVVFTAGRHSAQTAAGQPQTSVRSHETEQAESEQVKKDKMALAAAVTEGDVGAVKALASRGVDVNAKYKFGWPPLMGAVNRGRIDVVKTLLELGAKLNPDQALIGAAENGHLDVAQFMLDKGASAEANGSGGGTALMGAAVGGNEKIVQLLLDRGAEPNEKDENGNTPLFYATHNKESADSVRLLRSSELRL